MDARIVTRYSAVSGSQCNGDLMRKISFLLGLLIAASVHAATFNLFSPATGILKGSSSTYVTSAATSTDVVGLWSGVCTGTKYLSADGTCRSVTLGTVTSVALTVPSGLSVSGSPVTSSGTLAITTALSGLLKGTGSGFTTATSSDVTGLWTSTCDASAFLRGDGACSATLSGSAQTLTVFDSAASANRLRVMSDGGILIGAPTGGSLGPGTINASAMYINGSAVGTSSGAVSSVALAMPSVFTVSGSPVTSAGTLTASFASGQTQNQVLASPNGSSGAVSLRSLVAADIPAISLTSGVSGTLPVANGGTGVATLTGIVKASGTSAFSAASASDIVGLFSSCSGTQYLGADGACHAYSPPSGANPSASIGLTAVNGSASTFLRSDGAPALDQSIGPTWTGLHTWSTSSTNFNPLTFFANGNSSTNRGWAIRVGGGGDFQLRTTDDAGVQQNLALDFVRSGYSLTTMTFGNSSDNPSYSFAGTGAISGVGSGLTALNASNVSSGSLSDSRLSSNVGLKNGNSVWSGTNLVTGTVETSTSTTGVSTGARASLPAIELLNSSGGANAKRWELIDLGSELNLRTANDAASLASSILDVTRSGFAVGTMTFGNTTDNPAYSFSGTGRVTVGGTIGLSTAWSSVDTQPIVISSSLPAIQINESDQAANSQKWVEYANGGVFTIAADSDNEATNTHAIDITRSGTTISSIALSASTVSSSGAVLHPDGSAGSPAITFTSDTDTGIYRAGANDVRIVAGGAGNLQVNASAVSTLVPNLSADGSAAAPAFSFFNDSDNGVYRIGTNNIGISAGGTKVIDVNATTVNITAANAQVGGVAICLQDGTTCPGAVGGVDGASVVASGSTSCSDGSSCAIAYASENFDTGGYHDNSTNNSRITLPTSTGKFQCSANVSISSSGNSSASSQSSYYLLIVLDGSTSTKSVAAAKDLFWSPSAGSSFSGDLNVTTPILLTTGNTYAEAYFAATGFSSSSTAVANSGSSAAVNRFECHAAR